jgi:hypothetical protein
VIKYETFIIKSFDQTPKKEFGQTPKLLETFDQLKMSSEIRSTDPLSLSDSALIFDHPYGF